MKILTVENESYDLNHVPEQTDDIHFCVLDCTDSEYIDFQFLPLIYLEIFNSPCLVLGLGDHTINIPLDWSVLACDEDYTSFEVMPLTSLNDRGFHTVLFNPMKHLFPETKELEIKNVYADVKWTFPKLKTGNLLVMPVEDGKEPLCALFVKDHSKIPNPMAVSLIFE